MGLNQATPQQQLRGASHHWTSVNPTLKAGEIGYETDTGNFKIGDGITAWNSLSYFSSGGSGTVTSVAQTVPTGLTISGSPITASGTLAIAYDTGYQGYTTTEASKLSGIEAGAEVNTINSDVTGEPTGSDVVSNVVSLTQSEYDAGSPNASTLYVITDAKEDIYYQVDFSDQSTVITTGLAKKTFYMPFNMTVTSVVGTLKTADNALFTIDINEAGVSILSTKLTIDSAETTSTTAATAVVISDSSLAQWSQMTIDVDTAGTAAVGGSVTFIGKTV